jgi:hypothetical protein
MYENSFPHLQIYSVIVSGILFISSGKYTRRLAFSLKKKMSLISFLLLKCDMLTNFYLNLGRIPQQLASVFIITTAGHPYAAKAKRM